MKIIPIASNVVEIESDGMKISIHCSDRNIDIEAKGKLKINYPKVYKGLNHKCDDIVEFAFCEVEEQ